MFEKDEASLAAGDRALFHEFVGAPRAKSTKPAGKLKIKHDDDWSIVLAPTTEDCSDVTQVLKTYGKLARPCADGSGLLVNGFATEWSLFVEPPVKAAWGRGRRAVLVPRES